jgi:heat shock protein HslJ
MPGKARLTTVRIAIALIALAVVAGCGETVASPGGSDGLEGRTFLSESVTEAGETRELVDGTRIRMEFRDDGELRINAGCNHLMADVTIGGDTLEIGGVGGTAMGCDPDLHAQDDWIGEVLTGTTAWSLDGDVLTLTSGDTEIVLLDRVVADPDRPLEGTRWVVDTIITGSGDDGAAASMYAGSEGEAWLQIHEGAVTATSGCREFTGAVALDGDKVSFTDVVQTDPACPAELVDVDEAMTAILTADVSYDITAARLNLEHPDGEIGLGLHADE